MVGSKAKVDRTEFAYGLLIICRLFFSCRYKIHYGRLWLKWIENVAIPRHLGWSWYSQLQIYNSWIVCLPVGLQYIYSSNTTDLEQRFLNFLNCVNLNSFSLAGLHSCHSDTHYKKFNAVDDAKYDNRCFWYQLSLFLNMDHLVVHLRILSLNAFFLIKYVFILSAP